MDAFVNLAGVSLNDGRWTDEAKTRKFIIAEWNQPMKSFELLQNVKHKPKVFINASAVGIYPVSETAVYTEQATEQATIS